MKGTKSLYCNVSQRHSTTCSELGQNNVLCELQIGQNKTLGEFLRGQNLSLVTIKRILLLLRVLFSVRKVQFTAEKYSKNILMEKGITFEVLFNSNSLREKKFEDFSQITSALKRVIKSLI